MEPSGYLILGAGESLIGLSHDFEQEFVDGTVMYRKKAAAGRAA
jgi:chemotaxis methyl-accepting protein methylase